MKEQRRTTPSLSKGEQKKVVITLLGWVGDQYRSLRKVRAGVRLARLNPCHVPHYWEFRARQNHKLLFIPFLFLVRILLRENFGRVKGVTLFKRITMVRHKYWWISCCKRVFVKLIVRGIKVTFKFLGKVILKYTAFVRTQGMMQWEFSNFLQFQVDTLHNWAGFSNSPALFFHFLCLTEKEYSSAKCTVLCSYGGAEINIKRYIIGSKEEFFIR